MTADVVDAARLLAACLAQPEPEPGMVLVAHARLVDALNILDRIDA